MSGGKRFLLWIIKDIEDCQNELEEQLDAQAPKWQEYQYGNILIHPLTCMIKK